VSKQMISEKSERQLVSQRDDEIDLLELVGALWAGKFKIVAITAVFAIASVIYAMSVPNQYKATTLLSPSSGGGGGGGAMSGLGGLASLAGVSLGGGNSDESKIAQEIMQSWSFIERFIIDNDIATEVYYAEGWDKSSNQLKLDGHVYDVETKAWLAENDKIGAPSSWQLFGAFSNLIEVSEDKKSGLVSVSIEHYSPQIAKRWLDTYVDAINDFMRQRQVDKVNRSISYLQEQIGRTNIAEMQEVFYTIIYEETKSKMLAEASPDYAFVAVSPSMVPESKSQPRRALICIVITMVGGMLSVILVLAMHYAKKYY